MMVRATKKKFPPLAQPLQLSASGGLSRGDTASHLVVGDRGQVIPKNSLEQLERLDDAVFGALSGDPEALNEAYLRWREAVSSVEPELLEPSLHNYRQKAAESWGESLELPGQSLPKGFAALEILELFSEEKS